MNWYTVASAGASRHLWVRATGEGDPGDDKWISAGGHDVRKVLGEHGPVGLDVAVFWIQEPEHHGTQLTDFLWETGGLRLKLVSERLRRVLEDSGAQLQVFEDPDIRLRDGTGIPGYVGILEDTETPGPVHSLWHGKRSHRLVVSEGVRESIAREKLTGLEIRPVAGPFSGDRPDLTDE